MSPVVRPAYVERWAAMDAGQREAITGSTEAAAEVEALAERAGKMTTEEIAAEVAKTYNQLDALIARLRATDRHAERLRKARDRQFIVLMLLGEKQATVGQHAEMSPMMVAYAVGTAIKQRG